MTQLVDASSARALWYDGRGGATIRPAALPARTDGVVRVQALYGALSRGTERLVCEGRVPESEYDRMACPHQEGTFPGPVKYGYQTVGRVVAGSSKLEGRNVFALHPHQTLFDLPETALVPIPEDVPSARATMSANMETALNVLWDSGTSAGDRVLVVGAGVVGILVAYLTSRMPGASVTLCDLCPHDALADILPDVTITHPQDLANAGPYDVVVNTSGSAAGLQHAIDHAGLEARVVEASWYGAQETPLRLGGAFHSQRLQLVSSQVGRIPAGRVARWNHRRRLETAISLLSDPRLDALLAPAVDFDELPAHLPRMLSSAQWPPCPLIRYPAA